MQASLALLSATLSGWLAYQGGAKRYLYIAVSVLMGSMLPFTLLVIMPVKDRLLSEQKLSGDEVRLVMASCIGLLLLG